MSREARFPKVLRQMGAGSDASRGVTLIELMVAVAVLAIVMMAASPAFDAVILSSRLNSYSTEFIASVQTARSEAIKRNQRVVVCVSADGASCTTGGWQQGWLVFQDTDGDSVLDSGEEIIKVQQALAAGFLMKDAGGTATIAFNGVGALASAVALKLCRATPSPGSQDRLLEVSLTGRPNATRTSTGTCS